MPVLHTSPSAKKKCASGESRPRPDARRSPGSPRTPGASVFSIHCPLAPTALQHLSFLLFSVRIRPQSAPPPDAIHLPPSLLPAPDDPPIFALFSADPSAVRSPPTPFIFFLTVFLAPHNLPLLLFSLRTRPQSALPPDAFHLPPYPFPFTP